MKVLLLVSGSLRSFQDNLAYLPPEYDIAVYASRDEDDTYLNPQTIRALVEEPRIKTFMVEQPLPAGNNTVKQWYKLHRLWQAVPKTYTTYIRMRPDVRIRNPDELRAAVDRHLPLCIPEGNDRDGINDQVAIGTEETMSYYVGVYAHALAHSDRTSEWILFNHLASAHITRVPLAYTLILSRAKVIAIAGDSGSGKSTLCALIRPLFLFDKVLEYETDRYHKWARGDARWSTTSHLHPDANHLEKLEDDTFKLKLGQTVLAVDYDHTTGTFTPPQPIEPKENILLCGLHTLYTQQLRNLSDLKIYVDTSDELKTEWKLQRDTTARNQTVDEVRAKIESRRKDYVTHVAPQKEHADIVITRSTHQLRIDAPDWVPPPGYWDDPNVDMRDEIRAFVASLGLPPIDARAGFDGVIQLTVLRALYTQYGGVLGSVSSSRTSG